MSSNRTNLPVPPPPAGIAQGEAATLWLAAVKAFADLAEMKLQQPSWRPLLFTQATGPTIVDQWVGAFTPRSVLVVNPTSMPVWVATGAANPLAIGIAIPPLSPGIRLPILAANLTVGLDPANADLAATQYLVHLFRFATPD